MTTANRDTLLKLVTLLRPALSSQSFIPALQHIKFGDGHALAYDDVTAISCKFPLADEIGRCIPGELMIRALSSFSAETLTASMVDETTMLLASGRSKLKLPTLDLEKFPFKAPKGKPDMIPLDNEILDGIKRCLFSAGSDPTHPAQMGVTLDCEAGKAVLYSTDNVTLSRQQTKSAITLPGDTPIILPTFFCEQIMALGRAYPEDDVDLEVFPGALRCRFGAKAWCLTKTVVDLEPMNFAKAISRLVEIPKVKERLSRIPDNFDAAFGRALLVLGTEPDKATKVEAGKEAIRLLSKSAMGEADDELIFEGQEVRKDFYVDPTLVIRASKSCGSIAFYDRALLLATDDAGFIHLVSHCSP